MSTTGHAASAANSSPDALLRRFGLTVEDVARLTAQAAGQRVLDDTIETRLFSDAPTQSRFDIFRIFYTLDEFGLATELDNLLTSHIHGYSLELRQSGKSVFALSRGNARDPVDGALPWSTHVRMNIASVSKVITAAALVRLLAENNLSLDSPIHPWPPAYWSRGTNMELVTFREVMSHNAGFSASGRNFAAAKAQVADGAIRSTIPSLPVAYRNVNYIICRVLFATLQGVDPHAWDVDRLANFSDVNQDDFCDLVTRMAYVSYVNSAILSRAGLPWRSFDRDDTMALQYDYPTTGPGGHLPDGFDGDSGFAMCGSSGWLLSVDELLRVAAAIMRNRSILSCDLLDKMLESHCGVTDSYASALGTYYAKNGGDKSNEKPNEKWEQSLLFLIRGNREMAFLANSVHDSNVRLQDRFTAAIDGNIVTWPEYWARATWRKVKAMMGL